MLHLTLQHFFDTERVHFRAFVGWMVVLANLINSLAASLYLMFVVRCPDGAARLVCRAVHVAHTPGLG